MLSTILTVLLIINLVVLLVLITVFQHGNEGGIGSAFGGGNSSGFLGASGGANIIVRATWIGGVLFFGLSTSLAWVRTHDSFGVSREIDSALDSPELEELEDLSSDSTAGEIEATNNEQGVSNPSTNEPSLTSPNSPEDSASPANEDSDSQ